MQKEKEGKESKQSSINQRIQINTKNQQNTEKTAREDGRSLRLTENEKFDNKSFCKWIKLPNQTTEQLKGEKIHDPLMCYLQETRVQVFIWFCISAVQHTLCGSPAWALSWPGELPASLGALLRQGCALLVLSYSQRDYLQGLSPRREWLKSGQFPFPCKRIGPMDHVGALY